MKVEIDSGGYVSLDVTADETTGWASRPGSTWPCSTLRGHAVHFTVSSDGDLLDMFSVPVDGAMKNFSDFDGAEVTAFLDDLLDKASKHLLKARSVTAA